MLYFKFKIVVVGDFGVGKTTLITNFVEKKFRETYIPTMGVQFTKKTVEFNEFHIDLILWDIAGQDGFFEVRQNVQDRYVRE